jgi:predicted permease
MWRPLRFTAAEATDRGTRSLMVLGQLRADRTQQQANDEMVAIAAALATTYPESNETWGNRVFGVREIYLENGRRTYAVLGGAVGLVLLIACVNLASLVLARGAARQTEMAVRMALGASRGRVVRLLLAEGTLVALLGAGVGLLIARWGLAAILPLAPSWPVVLRETTMTPRSFAFALTVAALALQLFSALPAVRLSRPRLGGALTGAARTGGSADFRFRRALVVGQMALAVILMVGAGLLVRSVVNIVGADPGYNYQDVVTARVLMSGQDQGADVYFDDLLERAAALPGVTTAALVDSAPMDGSGDWVRVFIDGERRQAERALGADYRRVSSAYFDLLGIERVAGRLFGADDSDGTPVAIVNTEFVRRFLTDREPLGTLITLAPAMGAVSTEQQRAWRVVGVVETVADWGPMSFTTPMIYVPHAADPTASMTVMLRTDAAAETLIAPLRDIVRDVGDSPVDRVRTLSSYLHDSYEMQRFMLALLGAFAILAAFLAAIGLYGVMAYHVVQRRRELGVRLALGAASGDIARMVVRQGAGMALLAVVLGVAGAAPVARGMSSLYGGQLLVDMHWFDPTAFAVVPCVVLAFAILASWLPARRAARIDPVQALRTEA